MRHQKGDQIFDRHGESAWIHCNVLPEGGPLLLLGRVVGKRRRETIRSLRGDISVSAGERCLDGAGQPVISKFVSARQSPDVVEILEARIRQAEVYDRLKFFGDDG